MSDPVAELAGDLPFLAALQVVFVAVCLPAAGSAAGHSHSHGGSGPVTGGAGAGAGTGGGTGSGTEGTDEEKKKVGLGLGRSVRTAARRRAQHGKGERVWVKVVVCFLPPPPVFNVRRNCPCSWVPRYLPDEYSPR